MIFGAIRKFSTIDYPGKLACVLGTQGCNMHCPWCHNDDLVSFDVAPNRRIITEPEARQFLRDRAGFIEGVVISGGEPTLHKNLPEFCNSLKSIGFYVKLDTNGTNPGMLETLLQDRLVDYVAMDIKTDLQSYPAITKNAFQPETIVQSIDLLLNGPLPYEFRTTCVKPFVDHDRIAKIGELIRGADHLFLQKFDHSHVQHGVYAGNVAAGFDDAEMQDLLVRVKPYVAACDIR